MQKIGICLTAGGVLFQPFQLVLQDQRLKIGTAVVPGIQIPGRRIGGLALLIAAAVTDMGEAADQVKKFLI